MEMRPVTESILGYAITRSWCYLSKFSTSECYAVGTAGSSAPEILGAMDCDPPSPYEINHNENLY